jgi:lactate permease
MIALLDISPILLLLLSLLAFKLSAIKASAISFAVTLCIFFFHYGSGLRGICISTAKGAGLALFVVLIIWSAIFLYNLVNETGALHVINENICRIIQDRFYRFILLSWIFSAFLQGIAGFGVPVIVVTPLLIVMGFDPVISAAAVLVGHSWAISFGSMGSSIYAINMVTMTEIDEIIIFMAVFGSIVMFCTGLSVCFIYGGTDILFKKCPLVFTLSVCMGLMLYSLARLKMLSVMGLLTGFMGLICCCLVYRVFRRRNGVGKIQFYRTELHPVESLLPYALIIFLSLAFYVFDPQLGIGLDFDGYVTKFGHVVHPQNNYVTFNFLKSPFSVILISSVITVAYYAGKKKINRETIGKIARITAKKCVSTTITITFLLCMAVMMMDSGMIDHIANILVAATGKFYPFVSPFIGLLGAFVTGSNTNSNILFGGLQEIAATSLGFKAAIICGAQSIGASVGGGIGPTTVALGATAAQIQGRESSIYTKTLGPTLATTCVLAIANAIVALLYTTKGGV